MLRIQQNHALSSTIPTAEGNICGLLHYSIEIAPVTVVVLDRFKYPQIG